MSLLISIFNLILDILTVVILADVFVSYFLDIYHPVRRALDSVVQPLLTPIRRYVPPISGIDLSPIALIIVLQIIRWILALL
ncbi:MAG: hypothetical protein GTO14_18270 [Anaerolineales bacterium]|nr:hypothetical protein [Anaerolineales bacterium]